ncbi:MAG TPA: DUF2975 domain-containing protein [Phenylobacterium sp.]
MRALGPGSVSSFLKTILDVVYVALWIGVAVLGVITLLAILLSFNPEILGRVVFKAPNGEEVTGQSGLLVVGPLIAWTLYTGAILVIVERVRRIFTTLTAGDPFHPENVTRLRIIGLMLGGLELGRYAVWGLSAWLLPGQDRMGTGFTLTAWFSVLVVFVLAEVFREGARLRGEAELTI